ncbi:hypothetical protein GKQ77_00640 [Streptomyces sp. BG9H]|uniref:Uncharacterized protein n=1 Tax=Streptomyces anatolicus TaxID=2675858 RepID=A0ABS6YFA5_9ACTN|nr:hypothetical protein [Streptomyces anatolicus]MBW5420091.1 hypothetical protein [Streptomyces anatolicus]
MTRHLNRRAPVDQAAVIAAEAEGFLIAATAIAKKRAAERSSCVPALSARPGP